MSIVDRLRSRSSGSGSLLAGSGGLKPLARAKRIVIRYLGGAPLVTFCVTVHSLELLCFGV
eukprot:627856-Pyramimonas_sp.AAC.1